MSNIAIIPARSGSKGLPNKNIRLLAGKPLIYYTIKAALDSEVFDVVHVSTDSKDYADLARSLGADVPFLRSASSASDTASSWEVVKEVLSMYGNFESHFDTFMLLQPTSPLRNSQDVRNAYNLFYEKSAFSVVSVCEVDHSPLQCGVISGDLTMNDFINRAALYQRRQELKKYYRPNGAIYLASVEAFLTLNSIYSDRCYAYIMDKRRSIDIDEDFDFDICEMILHR